MPQHPEDPAVTSPDPSTDHPFLVAWIRSGLMAGVAWTLWSVFGAYLVLCVVNGAAWSTELSPSYGLLVIRLAVIAGLAVVSLVTLAFQNGELLLYYSVQIGMLVFPVACVARWARVLGARVRLSVTPSQLENYGSSGVSILAGLAFTVLVAVTVIDRGEPDAFAGNIYEFLLQSPNLQLWMLGAALLRIVTGFLSPGSPNVSSKPSEEATATAPEDVLSAAIKRSMVLMMLADGEIAPAEQSTIASVFEQVTGTALSIHDLAAEIETTRASKNGGLDDLQALAPDLTVEGRELVLKAMIAVAGADRNLQSAELDLLAQVGDLFEIPVERTQALLSELLEVV